MKIVVVYIAVTHGPLMAEYAARFAATYEMHPPLVEHETIVACNGGPIQLEESFLFLKMGAKFLPRTNDMGWDISAYQDVAKKTDADFMVCFGETVHFHRPGWLLRLATERKRYGPGMYGCFASYLVRPHLNTSAFAIDPVYLRNHPRVFDHNSRYGFEHGYNSIVNTVAKKGGQTKLVTWDGAFDRSEWRKPKNILWRATNPTVLSGVTTHSDTPHHRTAPNEIGNVARIPCASQDLSCNETGCETLLRRYEVRDCDMAWGLPRNPTVAAKG